MHRDRETSFQDTTTQTAFNTTALPPSAHAAEAFGERADGIPASKAPRKRSRHDALVAVLTAGFVGFVLDGRPHAGGDWRELKQQGYVRFLTGDVRGAERLDRLALADTDKMGPRGIEAGMVLSNLAADLRAQGRNESAEHALEKSLAAYRADRLSEPKQVYQAIIALSSAYLRDEKFGKAIPLLREALELGATLPATDSRGAYSDLEDLASAYKGMRRPGEADAFFKKAVAAAPTNFARDHILAEWHAP